MRVLVTVSSLPHEYNLAQKAGKIVSRELDNLDIYNEVVELKNLEKLNDVLKYIECFDLVYIVSYGGIGENGVLQSILESYHIPYTGCSATVSAVCRDKYFFSKLSKILNINTPKTFKVDGLMSIDSIEKFIIRNQMRFPLVIKPRFLSGSSHGVKKVNSLQDIQENLPDLLNIDPHLLIQEYIEGNDYIVAAIFQGDEIKVGVSKARINKDIDFEERYNSGENMFIVDDSQNGINSKLKKYTQKILDYYEIDGTCYLDFRVCGEDVYFIELGTMYGLSENSAVPTLAKRFGISLTDLIKSDIHSGLTRKKGHFGY